VRDARDAEVGARKAAQSAILRALRYQAASSRTNLRAWLTTKRA
jgi:hypothetical protein